MSRLNKAELYIARRKLLLKRTEAQMPRGYYEALDRAPNARGHLTVETRPAGEVDDPDAWEKVVDQKNLVVTQAEVLMAQMAIGAANSAFNYIELGDPAFPAQSPALTDTILQQTTAQRKVGTVTASNNVATTEVIFLTGDANGFTYTEAGLFTGVLGAGTMFARKAFAAITKTNAFQMRFTWRITFLVNTDGGDCSGVGLIAPTTVASFNVATAVGGEASIAALFDFVVGANHVDVFLDRQRLYPGLHYNEAGAGSLIGPVLGPAGNKGINLAGFTLNPANEVLLIQRTLV